MKKIYLLLMLFGTVGVNAQNQSLNMGGLTPKTNFQKSTTYTSSMKIKNQVNHLGEFVPKSNSCADTLLYPDSKQYIHDQNEYYISYLKDDYGAGDAEYAQVFKTGNTPLMIDGIDFIAGVPASVGGQALSLKLSIYNVASNGTPNATALTSFVYTIPASADTANRLRHAVLPTSLSVTNDFAVGITLVDTTQDVKLIVTDPVFNSTYDEQLLFIKSDRYNFPFTSIRAYYQLFNQNFDFDVLIYPVVSYDVEASVTVDSIACSNTPVSITGTFSPSSVATNRFLNYYAFTDYFNYSSVVNQTHIIAPTGDPSLTFNASSYNYTYTVADTFDVAYLYNVGFVADCYDIALDEIVIVDKPNTAFSYSGNTFCAASSNVSPSITESGGTFTSSPSGLIIDATTGEIDFANSTEGSYTITYTVTNGACADTVSHSITIDSTVDASFSFSSNTFCTLTSNVSPSVTALGGIFTSSSPDLVIDTVTGEINLTSSIGGNYTITYEVINGACSDIVSNPITILSNVDASFSYPSNTFCPSSSNVSPSITESGGTFTSSPSGLIIDATTGEIDFTSSTEGSYIVTYAVTNGVCTDTVTRVITISSNIDATFSYGQNEYCINDTNAQVVFAAGASAGVFTADINGLSINPNTGEINFSASPANTYIVTNTISVSGCPSDAKSDTIEIKDIPVISMNIVSAICQGDSAVTLNATPTGGTWSGTGVNGNEFDPAAANIGSNTVTYTVVNGGCTNAMNTTIQVDEMPTIQITNVAALCEDNSAVTLNATPTGGTWSGAGVNGNEFNPATANVGSNTVTYTVVNGECTNAMNTTIQVDEMPTIQITNVADLCKGNGAVTLNATPTGGTWSGTGVNGNEFNPATANVGSNTVTYTVVNGGCTNAMDATIQVDEMPVISINPVGEICDNASSVQLSATPMGGTFSGPGVTGNTFNPANAQVGQNTITYTVTNGSCTDSKTINITVNQCVAVDEVDVIHANVFPVPTKDYLNIVSEFDLSGELFSLEGKTVISNMNILGNVVYQVNIEGLSKGMYMLRLSNGQMNTTKRIVIE